MIRLVLGDTRPDLIFEIERDGEYGQSLTDEISTVTFKLKKPSGAIVSVPLTLVSGPLTKYAGSFAPGDLDEAQPEKAMYGELIVAFTDASVQHAVRPFEVYIRPEYGDFS